MKIVVLGAAGRMGSMRARHLIEMGHQVRCIDPAPLPDDLKKYAPDSMESDAIVIATPAENHLNDLRGAIAYEQHIFVEKPICLIGQTAATRIAMKEADQQGLIVNVGYNLRFHPAVMQVKDAIISGQLKPLWGSFLLRQKPQRPLAHFLEEWASHEVDLALHLLGGWSGFDDLYNDGNPNILRVAIAHFDKASNRKSVSFIHADAVTKPFRRAFTIVDQDGQSITCDIESDHVQESHYKAELQAWVDQIERQKRADEEKVVIVSKEMPLATGWDGLSVIDLLEKLR